MRGVAAGRDPSRGAGRLRRAALCTAAALALLPGEALSEPPACSASASIVPADAFVGQQLLYRLEILARDDVRSVEWIEPPSFPGFRAERLPGRPHSGEVERDGIRYRAREEHRALFAERPGDHRIGVAGIRCEIGGGESIESEVPEARVRVQPIPPDGAPPSFDGVVGPVALRVRVAPRRIALGGSIHVAASLQGSGNLWDAGDPFPDLSTWGASRGVEVFRRTPELRLFPGQRLTVRRIHHYDLVPTTAGALTIPAATLDIFDPDRRAYARVSSDASRVEIDPGVVGEDAASPGPRPASAPPLRRPSVGFGWPAAFLGLAVIAGIAGWWIRRGRRRTSRAREALATLRRMDAADVDAAALARALRTGLSDHRSETGSPVDEPLVSGALSGAVAEAAALLEALDRARFARDATPPDRAAVEAVLERLG